MDSGVWLGVEDGAPVVVRRVGADGRDRLVRTATQLERATHPGVVRIVASRPWGDGWELVTEYGGRSVAAARWATVDDVAALGAAVATTLADLHECGVVHGRLGASRILIGSGDRPVLCGLAPAGGPGEPSGAPADDIAALGRVLHDLLAPLTASGAPAQARLTALRAIVEGTGGVPSSRRPTARRLSAELRTPAGVARSREPSGLPTARGGPRRGPSARPVRRRRRAPAVWPVVVGVLAIALAVVVVVGRPASRGGPAAPASSTRSAVDTTAVPRCVATEQTSIAAGSCGRDVSVEGAAVVVDGQRYVVGVEGDVVAVADWDCAGGLRAAVLRPATGEVRVFAAFTSDRVLSVARAERAARATSLAIRGRGGCAILGVLEAPAEGTAPATPDRMPASMDELTGQQHGP